MLARVTVGGVGGCRLSVGITWQVSAQSGVKLRPPFMRLVHPMIHLSFVNPSRAILGACSTGLFSSVAGPNLKATLMNVNPPESRGSVFCIMYLADCIGNGFGPYIVGNAIAEVDARCVPRKVNRYPWCRCRCACAGVCVLVCVCWHVAYVHVRVLMCLCGCWSGCAC